MASVFNARERSEGEWRSLLMDADPRFSLKGVVQPEGSALAFIEVVWDGDGA